MLVFLCVAGSHLLSQSADNSALERYSEEGQKAFAAGRFDEAEQAYEQLRALVPGSAEVNAQLGLIYFRDRKFDQAVSALSQALKLNPTLPRADTLLAMSLSELGRYDAALPGLNAGFHHSPEAAVKRMCGLQLVRAYTSLQRTDKALQIVQELDQLYPNDPEILYRTGQVYENLASLTLQKLAQTAPGSIWMHLAEAEAYEGQGRYEAAITEYHQVLSADPHRPGIHYLLGRTLLALSRRTNTSEDERSALKEFEQELQVDPNSTSAAYEIGEIHRRSGEYKEAQKSFEFALKYYPDFEKAHLGLAAVLTALHKPELALPHLQRAVALNAQNEVSWYRLSQAYGLLGNAEQQKKAFSEFQRLRSQKPKREQTGQEVFAPSEVTKQETDPTGPQ